VFHYPQKILFQHCDPAGIVFYPRYYEMLNACIEAWFDEVLGYSFAKMHGADGRGVPTVWQNAEFHAPSRHGDALGFALRVTQVGTSSLDLEVQATCDKDQRAHFTCRLVFIRKDTGRSEPWPPELRQKLLNISKEDM
jgi:4-hydroxybenzoyl-CoA thioesterase